MKTARSNSQLFADGRQFEEAGKWEDAAKAYQRVVDNDPGNQDAVARTIARHVAHIGNVVSATVRVAFVIDENGRTHDVHADPTSGFKGVDRAAEGVVREMRFTAPAKDGRPVRVRITMPISFTPTP